MEQPALAFIITKQHRDGFFVILIFSSSLLGEFLHHFTELCVLL